MAITGNRKALVLVRLAKKKKKKNFLAQVCAISFEDVHLLLVVFRDVPICEA